MAAEHTEHAGPDLAQGVALEDLTDGRPFAGRIGEDSVVLVRRGDDVFAIGGTCTHYSGPLGEGLVVGDTIRCPWHHACFSLRTGEAVGAPALNPVPRWDVEIRDGVVRLSAKREAGPLDAFGRQATAPDPVVIVGAGAAGSAAAEMLRREGYAGPVSLVDADETAPYDRPNLSKDYLAGNAPEEWLPLRPEGFWAEHDIERIAASAVAIDSAARRVTLADGRSLRFGALLLATGATPVRLTLPGSDMAHVHTLRSLSDCRSIIARAEGVDSALVLGASFIGMEVAAALRSRGLDVTVVAPDAVPFERTLGAELGRLLQDAHESNGVHFRLGRTAARIDGTAVTLDDGEEVAAGLVVVGVGVRPDTRLAETAGVTIDDGVVVDEYLETSVRGIFAAGDIARYPYAANGERVRVEHWVAAQRQGQAAARSMLGMRRAFTDPPFFWTRQWDVGINYVGRGGGVDDVRVDGDLTAQDATVRYFAGGRMTAAATVGRDLESLRIEAELESA